MREARVVSARSGEEAAAGALRRLSGGRASALRAAAPREPPAPLDRVDLAVGECGARPLQGPRARTHQSAARLGPLVRNLRVLPARTHLQFESESDCRQQMRDDT